MWGRGTTLVVFSQPGVSPVAFVTPFTGFYLAPPDRWLIRTKFSAEEANFLSGGSIIFYRERPAGPSGLKTFRRRQAKQLRRTTELFEARKIFRREFRSQLSARRFESGTSIVVLCPRLT